VRVCVQPLRDSLTQDFHYTENKASYKTLVLTYPYAVVIPLTLTRSPSWTLPNQVSYLKGSSMESFTLGPMLVFWPHSVFGQNHLYVKDVVNRDSTWQSIFKTLHCEKLEDFRFPGNRLDEVSSRTDIHLSGRRVHPDEMPERPVSSVWTMYLFRPDPTLYREASVPSCIRPDISAARPDAYQYLNSLRFFPSSNKGKIDQPSGRCGIPSGRESP